MMQRKHYQPLTIPVLSWNKKSEDGFSAELVVGPLECGFGVTLGNALRRVVLSSIEGPAITAVVIEGINNEFSVLPGVVQDSLELILNLRKIIIKNDSGLAGKMTLDVRRPGLVRVSDIVHDSHLSLVNKDFVIAEVAEGGSLKIEFFVENGRGYVSASWPAEVSLQPDGKIYLDSQFSPITNVEFRVEQTRVGDEIGFDKLFFKVDTNGAIKSTEAISYAASVLRSQLEYFLTCEEIAFKPSAFEAVEHQDIIVDEIGVGAPQGYSVDLFLKSIDDLELSVRAHNCLINAGIKKVIDLVNMTDDDVLKLKNFGRKSLKEVKEVLAAFGLRFGMNVKELDLKKAIKRKTERTGKDEV